MANEFCTGAIHLYVGPMANNKNLPGIVYLGTCEDKPDHSVERTYKALNNDLTSQRAFDYVYAGGSEAVVSLTLTRWTQSVILAMERSPISGITGGDTWNDIGSLMGQEELGIVLYMVYQFGGIGPARPSMVGQENGKRYFQTIYWGPEKDEGGTKERKKHVVFRAWKKNNSANQTLLLYDYDVSQAAGIPPV